MLPVTFAKCLDSLRCVTNQQKELPNNNNFEWFTFSDAFFCSEILVQIDSNDKTEIKQVWEYFGKNLSSKPVKTALLDDGLLLIYENHKGTTNNAKRNKI